MQGRNRRPCGDEVASRRPLLKYAVPVYKNRLLLLLCLPFSIVYFFSFLTFLSFLAFFSFLYPSFPLHSLFPSSPFLSLFPFYPSSLFRPFFSFPALLLFSFISKFLLFLLISFLLFCLIDYIGYISLPLRIDLLVM